MNKNGRITVATCNLNQWALDFDGNLKRTLQSCDEAKAAGASYRLGPELETCGYGCEDHFLELDTFEHSWESLEMLFEKGATDDLFCDFGMPILFAGARYNCRILCQNRKILLIRPKTAMADNGNYREGRYFTAYRVPDSGREEEYLLSAHWKEKFGQTKAPFGLMSIQTSGGQTIGVETCEELWTPRSSHIDLALNGVEIIGNGSGSHHELRKLNARLELIISATRKCGGLYLYSNQRGCDGGRTYYDGCSMIVCNGQVLAQAKQFDISDVQTIVATVDLNDIKSYRASIPSFGIQISLMRQVENNPSILFYDDVSMVSRKNSDGKWPKGTKEIKLTFHSPEEECCMGPACWLWDYMRRSGATGFFLPLSGGADSASSALIVGCMCKMVYDGAKQDPTSQVASDIRRICDKEKDESWVPSSPQEIAGHIFHTSFMGTEYSSTATLSRAKRIAECIGSYHIALKIDIVIAALLQMLFICCNLKPKFLSQGGSTTEDLALQNIQARIRMVTAYLLAQLLPVVRGKKGFLLVLGSANVDEGLRGYMTKYDCSSADLNPIGAIAKGDLKRMLLWYAKEYDYDVLKETANATPTAELIPIIGDKANHTQADEDEMGMSYAELSQYGRLRKVVRCGPVSMFRKLLVEWNHLSAKEVADKVKKFFKFYSINRHKMCTITPSYHAEGYSPDDNRYDLRQFLYNTRWPRQFKAIDDEVDEIEQELKDSRPMKKKRSPGKR